MPPKISTTNNHDHSHHEQGLLCGGGIYGADRLNEKMERAHDLFVLEGRGLPNNWKLTAVLMTPFTEDELAPIVTELSAWKQRDRWLDETYHERVATIVLWIAGQPWSREDRFGAAWAAMWFGMTFHGFEPVAGHNFRLRWPEPEFFDMFAALDDSVLGFASFLRVAYIHPDERQRRQVWRHLLLIRRRQQVGQQLQALLDRPLPHRYIDLRAAKPARPSSRHLHRVVRR